MRESTLSPAAASDRAVPMSRRTTLVLVMAAVFLYWIALYLYVPTLPTYTSSKTDDLALVGTVLSMYGLWQALVRLPLGITADWLGRRKPFIVVGFILAALGAYLMGRADTAQGILVGRAVTGLAAGTWVPLVVVFSSLFPPEEAVRATSLLTFVGSAGRMLATGATSRLNAWGEALSAEGGPLEAYGPYAFAFFLATVAALVAVLTVLPSRETRRPPRPPSLSSLSRLFVRRDVLLPSLLALVTQYAVWGTTFGFMPILATNLGATDADLSRLVVLSIAMIMVGNFLTPFLMRGLGARGMVALSFVLMAMGVGLMAVSPSVAFIYVSQALIGIFQGFSSPALMGMSIQQVDDSERTTAMGLHQSVYAIGMFAGPWLSGILAKAMGVQPMFGVTAVGCLALGLLGARWLGGPRAARMAGAAER